MPGLTGAMIAGAALAGWLTDRSVQAYESVLDLREQWNGEKNDIW